MNQENLDRLAAAPNEKELLRSIEAMCRPFGSLKAIGLFPDKRRRECICYVELDSPNQHAELIEQLGGEACGKSVALRFPFRQAQNQAGAGRRPARTSDGSAAKLDNRRTRFASTTFACPLMGRAVDVHASYKIGAGRAEAESARADAKTDCSAKHQCVISAHHGNSASFDWSRCAFVKAQKLQ